MEELRPIGEILAVFPMARGEQVSPGGLIVPDARDEYIQYGQIKAMGSLVNEKRPVDEKLQVGDKIIFRKVAGPSVVSNRENILLIKAEHVIAVIYGEPDPPQPGVLASEQKESPSS